MCLWVLPVRLCACVCLTAYVCVYVYVCVRVCSRRQRVEHFCYTQLVSAYQTAATGTRNYCPTRTCGYIRILPVPYPSCMSFALLPTDRVHARLIGLQLNL